MFMPGIKSVFKCPEKYKDIFKNSTCLLTISVGQEMHEGEKFLSTIRLVNSAFKNCVILVGDSLQRHAMSIADRESSNEFYEHSLLEGDWWLERNKEYYSQLTIPYHIIRWDYWLAHDEYQHFYSKICESYSEDPGYKSAFQKTIDEFLIRYRRRLNSSQRLNEEKAADVCLEYLKEECAALCLWVEGGFHFEVYPSQRNLAMAATHEKFVKPFYPDLLLPVAIKFKNRKQLNPQVFHFNEKNTPHLLLADIHP